MEEIVHKEHVQVFLVMIAKDALALYVTCSYPFLEAVAAKVVPEFSFIPSVGVGSGSGWMSD